MIETAGLEAVSKARGRAKRDLIAHAAVIARTLDLTSQSLKANIIALKSKEIEEWAMVEAILDDIFGIVGELDLTRFMAKLVVYQIADLEKRRAEHLDRSQTI